MKPLGCLSSARGKRSRSLFLYSLPLTTKHLLTPPPAACLSFHRVTQPCFRLNPQISIVGSAEWVGKWDAGFQRECGAQGGGGWGWKETLPPSRVAEPDCHRPAYATEAGKVGQCLYCRGEMLNRVWFKTGFFCSLEALAGTMRSGKVEHTLKFLLNIGIITFFLSLYPLL